MSGSVNYNLTDDEEMAFKELEKRIFGESKGNSERDFLLYRFLKARKFDVHNAEIMLRNHLKFRQKLELDTILDKYKPDEILTTYIPVSFMGLDKDGDLLVFVDIGALDLIGITKSVKKEDMIKYSMYFLELAKKEIFEQSTKLGKIAGGTLIFDESDIQLVQVTNKTVIQLVVELFRTYEANFPELLKVQYTLNGPGYMSYIWNTLKWVFPVETLQKIKVFGRDGYQSELLNLIGSEKLPAYLGGTRTDPDGNPKCLTVIKRGKEVPKHYYLKNSENLLRNQPDAKKYSVKSRSRINVPHEVEIPGSSIEWQFESEAHDIGFGLLFKPNEDEDLEVILPITRVSAHLQREIGTFGCIRPGIYIIVLDNSFSWLRGKHIAMKSSICKPRQERETEN